VDSITAGGKMDVPWFQRMFWANLQGFIAACLLVRGGADALGAIQAVAITVGLPFTVVMIVMIISLYLGIHDDYKKMKA
jgi:betaine/carnitine transporter, BCCT family